ncbi:MAG: tRNA epoxyqueuosine(34) reductase QueG [Thermotogae bacterium]|nr:tRNA epoxyqueuosine(34) reductase QueG [Thermotogota bacterium]
MEKRIKAYLRELGFDAVGITSLIDFPTFETRRRVREWVFAGMHAHMVWFERSLEVRLNPRRLLEGAASAVMVTMHYGRRYINPKLKISRYATRRDYHRVFRKLLRKFVRWAEKEVGGRFFTFSDSAPVLEKELAVKSGLGWIGKNSLLVTPNLGPNVLLGGVFTDLVLKPDDPFPYDWCGRCNRCVEACPTGAISEYRTVDARKCVSYWSIEYKGGSLPPSVSLHGWVFGCDVCLNVCPWGEKTPERANPHLRAKEDVFENLTTDNILRMGEKEFRRRFEGTPVMRAGLETIKRNIRAKR